MKTLYPLIALSALFLENLMGDSIYDITVDTIDGESQTLEDYAGKVLLIVNVASKCGFTGQYENLESLYQDNKDKGLVVLGFPCNQFLRQEPGTDEEIKSFCALEYGVSFPMFSKINVNGKNQHPLYAALTGKDSPFPGRISWNFNKFLVSREGVILARFGSRANPESKEIIAAIENAL